MRFPFSSSMHRSGVPRDGNRAVLLVAVCCGVLTVSSSADSQLKKEPPRRTVILPVDTTTEKSALPLPEFDLPEFIITGKEAIQVPEVAKPDLVGEAPPGDSWADTWVRVRDDAPRPLDEPKRQGEFARRGGALEGGIAASYGSYQTASFDGWFGRNLGNGEFLIKGGYTSSSGHTANADNRQGRSSLRGSLYVPDDYFAFPGARFGGNIALDGKSYRFYGSQTPALKRTLSRFEAGMNVESSLRGALDYTSTLSVHSTTLKDTSEASAVEVEVDMTGRSSLPLFDIQLGVRAFLNSYRAPIPSSDPSLLQLSFSARSHVADSVVDLVAGVEISNAHGSDGTAEWLFDPRLSMFWYLRPSLTVFAKFEPHVQRATLSSFADENPYITTLSAIRHPHLATDFSIGATYEVARSLHGTAAINYEQIDNAPLYVETRSGGVWLIEYRGTTRVLSFDLDMYAEITRRDYVGGSLHLRSVRNSQTGKVIPYVAPVVISGVYQHRFAAGVTVGGIIQVMGQRYVDPQASRSLGAFTLCDVRTEYTPVPRFSLTLHLGNVLDQNRTAWQGYPGPGRTVSFGLGYSW